MSDVIAAPAAPALAPAAPVTPAAPAAAAPKPDAGANGAAPVAAAKPGAPAAPAAPGSKPPAGAEVTDIQKEGAPANPEKPYKLTADGKVYHVSLEDALKLASKGIGAERKFQDASKATKNVEAFLQQLKTDPMSVLMNPKLGLDFKKLAQEFLVKEIEREQMTPEQRELEDAKAKLREMDEEKSEAKKREEAAVMTRLTEEAKANYEKDIVSTIEAEKLPKTRGIVRRIAYYLDQGLRRGVEFSAKDVVPFVRNDINKEIIEMFNVLDGAALAEMMGDGNVKKLNESLLSKMHQPDAPTGGGTPAGGAAPASGEPVRKLTKVEWRKEMDKKF